MGTVAEGPIDIQVALPSSDGIAKVHGLLHQIKKRKTLAPEEYRELGRVLAESLAVEVGETLKGRLGRLRIESSSVPWEFLSLNGQGHFVLQSGNHIIRHVPGPTRPVKATEILRVLLVSANPETERYPDLPAAHKEMRSILEALQSPECRGLAIDCLEHATVKSLRKRIGELRPDVLHFVGHGDIKPSGPAIILEGSRPGQEEPLYGDELASWLSEAGITMAVLSGCATALLGQQLASCGIPIAIGMQFPISDGASHHFSRALYSSIAEGSSVEEAVSQGRAAISGWGPDWAFPVLITSCPEARLVRPAAKEAPNNLPYEQEAFVGRAQEVATAKRLLTAGQARLLTVFAMGGMGKTRFATRVSRELLSESAAFPNGIWWVSCETLATREEIVAATAAATNFEGPVATEGAVLAHLAGKKALLVFDCFERLIEHASFLRAILTGTGGIRVLVTSRIILELPSEHEFALNPLSLKRSSGQFSESIDLFVTAAQRVDPGFKVDSKNRKLLLSLVQLLEGVPLALLLAAGRLRHFTLEQLHEQVEKRRLEVLRRRSPADDKHANLVRVVRDSFELLDEAERALAIALSVFQGGFFAEDAGAVLAETAGLEDGIADLRDNSLLVTQIVEGRMRYRALDTIREYLESISAGIDLASIKRRHAEHYGQKAREVRRSFEQDEWAAANARLALEIGNYRAATRHALELADDGLVEVFASSLARAYLEAGAIGDFTKLADAAEGLASAKGDLSLLIELKGLRGTMARREDRLDEAQRLWLERADLCARFGDTEGEADTLLDLANLALEEDDLVFAGQMLDRFSPLEPKLHSLPLEASGLLIAAELELRHHRPEEALALAQRAEGLVEVVPISRDVFFVWIALARVNAGAGAASKSVDLCKRMFAETLDSGYLHYAWSALLQLAKSSEAEAAMAVAIADRIPRTLSPRLRAATLKAKAKLEAKGISMPHIAGKDWKVTAREWIETV